MSEKVRIIKLTFTKINLLKMNDLLEFIADYSAEKYISKSSYNIVYNMYGGYYNLYIRTEDIASYEDHEFLIKLWRKKITEKGE